MSKQVAGSCAQANGRPAFDFLNILPWQMPGNPRIPHKKSIKTGAGNLHRYDTIFCKPPIRALRSESDGLLDTC